MARFPARASRAHSTVFRNRRLDLGFYRGGDEQSDPQIRRDECAGYRVQQQQAPANRDVEHELARLIADYVDRFRIGLTVIAPADVEYDDRTVVEPDIFVAPLLEGRRPRSYADLGGLLLVVEVISPSTAAVIASLRVRVIPATAPQAFGWRFSQASSVYQLNQTHVKNLAGDRMRHGPGLNGRGVSLRVRVSEA